ncbi:unnamed protein product [Rhizoctonia solani]|uniref:Uncharacterized protein n=1 Tax=Rhizoctonia solani TaxID=456999 RepID=A0A8H2XCE3_9AGAM|nr:unnamed protein product [Rhizoctonia solani]
MDTLKDVNTRVVDGKFGGNSEVQLYGTHTSGGAEKGEQALDASGADDVKAEIVMKAAYSLPGILLLNF